MRTLPTGRSSTSGVSPISSSSDGATTLRIAPPEVDGRAELAEQLVDAPGARRRVRGDARAAVALDQFGLSAMQPREAEQVAPRIPGAVLDHPLPPLAPEQCV